MFAAKQQTQAWTKLGVPFKVDQQSSWMQTHASFPKAIELDDVIRVFFTTRDENQRGRLASVDLDKTNPMKVLGYSQEPILELGRPGTFDDCGVTPSSALWVGDKVYLYYHGWNALQHTPHRLTTGLAISEDRGKTFKRYSEAPLFDRTDKEPIFSNNPCVIRDHDQWHMYYLNLEAWVPINGRFEGKFTLYYAHSKDGITWDRDARVAIPKHYDFECISNASVIKEAGIFKMWYSYRSIEDFRLGNGAYKIGYAESTDAINWVRMDQQIVLDQMKDEFDSVMQAFPSVLDVNGNRYMFYNGTGFGKTGIGLAVLNKE